MESGKFLSEEEIRRLKRDLDETERERSELQKQLHQMRVEADKVQQYQSAYLSNNKAFNEKMDDIVN